MSDEDYKPDEHLKRLRNTLEISLNGNMSGDPDSWYLRVLWGISDAEDEFRRSLDKAFESGHIDYNAYLKTVMDKTNPFGDVREEVRIIYKFYKDRNFNLF